MKSSGILVAWWSTLVAVVVISLTQGDLAMGVLTWLAVWVVFTTRSRYTPNAGRRYLIRQTKRRNNRGGSCV